MALRVAVIGMGPIGNLHADVYREHALVDLVGVCDRVKARADFAADRLGVPAFTDVSDMLSSLHPDCCSVTTAGVENGSDHYEPTLLALESGSHVLCEKPICNEMPKAAEMVARAASLKRCLGVNLNHRFTPAARLARRWMDEGRIGPPLFVNMSMWIQNANESSPWFHIKSLHPHTIDVMRYFCGEIESVHCFATRAPGRRIWSTAQFNLRFAHGTVGSLTGSYDIARGHPMERCEVAGLQGRFVIEDMFREATLFPAGKLEKTVYTNPVFGGMRDFNDTFRNRIGTFVEQIMQGVSPEAIDGSGADGLAAQAVLDAAVRSVETDAVVQVLKSG